MPSSAALAASLPSTVVPLAVALGAGLLVGIERERHKGRGPGRAPAGVRSFAMAAVCGALAQLLDQPALVAAGALLVGGLMLLGYWREPRRSRGRAAAGPAGARSVAHGMDPRLDPGITTELALFATYLIGVLAVSQAALAAALAVVVAGLLAARTRLHRFSTRVLTADELHDLLLLAAAVLIVLPLLPDRPVAWMAQVNPRDLWRLAVLLMALQAAGHVAQRVAGARMGLALSGLAAGFVSSTATIGAMGARSRQQPDERAACVAAGLCSNIATVTQLALIGLATAPALLRASAPALAAAGVAAVAAALLAWWRVPAQAAAREAPRQHAFDARQALAFAALLSGVTTAVSWVGHLAGRLAVEGGMALAGFVDVHAAAASAFALGRQGQLDPRAMTLAILLAVSTNTISKLGAAWAGGWPYALRVWPGLIAIPAAAWLAWWRWVT